MEKAYRIAIKVEAPLSTYVGAPQTVYTLVQDDGTMIRTKLARRSDWEVGDVVFIEEELVRMNLVE